MYTPNDFNGNKRYYALTQLHCKLLSAQITIRVHEIILPYKKEFFIVPV